MAKAKAKVKESVAAIEPAEVFTGVAYTVQASREKGFNNFKICTLFIVDGGIVHIEKSQEYAGFEAISRTEILVNSSLWNLSSRYEDGAYQSLGGDHRDALINRLKANDPELLKTIMPALFVKGEK